MEINSIFYRARKAYMQGRGLVLGALLISGQAMATVTCDQASPGDSVDNGAGKLYLVVEDGWGDYGIKNPRIIEGVVAGTKPVCTSLLTDISNLFAPFRRHSATFREIVGDITDWDTRHVTNLSGTFQDNEFNQAIGGWDVSSVVDFSYAFANNQAFNQALETWQTGNATNMSHLFYHSQFEGNISNWTVCQVLDRTDFATGSPIDGDLARLPGFHRCGESKLTATIIQHPAEYIAIHQESDFEVLFRNEGAAIAPHLSFHFNAPQSDIIAVEDSCQAIKQLAPGEFCTFLAHLHPTTAQANAQFLAQLKQDERHQAIAKAIIQIESDYLEPSFIQAIPDPSELGQHYPFEYAIDNRSAHLSASALSFEASDFVADGVTLNQAANNCQSLSDQMLSPGASCLISGTFTPQRKGQELNIAAKLHYSEGENINLFGHTTVLEHLVTGAKSPDIPARTVFGKTYPFRYAFTNQSANYALTDVVIDQQLPAGATLNAAQSSCLNSTSLAPSASCTLAGQFQPSAEGDARLAMIFNSRQSQNNRLSSPTNTRKITAQGRAVAPAITNQGQTYAFSFTFTNPDSTDEITRLSLRYDFPAALQAHINPASSCLTLANNNLPAQTSCQIEGTFTPTGNNTYSLKTTLNFLEGDALSLTASTSVKGGIVYCKHQNPGETFTTAGGKTYIVASNASIRSDIQRWLAGYIDGVCTSHVTDMSHLFEENQQFNANISDWDVSSVTNMDSMFYCSHGEGEFNQDISRWDVSNVTNMKLMFCGTSHFNQNISAWDVSSVTNMQSMFATALAFNIDIGSWNVSRVTDMQWMFYCNHNYGTCSFNHNLSGWHVSQVTSCSQFNTGGGGHLSPSYFPRFTQCNPALFSQPPPWAQEASFATMTYF